MLAPMSRVAWLLLLAACSSPSNEPAPPPPQLAPPPAPPPPPPARLPPDAPDSDALLTSFSLLGASVDQAHVLIANVAAPANTMGIQLRVLSATTGALEKSLPLLELTRLPGVGDDPPLAVDTALVAELRAAADLIVDYPAAVGAPIVTSTDRRVIAAYRELRWLVVQGDTAVAWPPDLGTPWVAPDGKRALYAMTDGIYAVDLSTRARTKLAAATNVTSIERWRVSADHAYVRIPYGAVEPCVAEIPLDAGKPRPPQCFGNKEPAPIMAISDNGTWLAMLTITRTGKKRVRIIDLDKHAKVFDFAALDLGPAAAAATLIVGPTGRAYAIRASHAYALDASNLVFELPHDEAQTSCIVVGRQLACLSGTKLVLTAPNP